MNNDLRPINTLPNFKRFCMTIGELPTSYLETMTYYEMLVWFTEYMKNTIIPTINNNGLAVKELQDKYIELKNFVDNYFDNLDIQEEINNKLDEMAESGELTDIIAQYLGLAGMLTFNTVNEMKQATNLANGSTTKTLGYYNLNDGGSATYKIRNITNQDIIDESFIISLENENLVGELIYKDEINVLQLGCVNNDESSASKNTNIIINSFNKIKKLLIPSGTFYVNSINIPANISIIGNSDNSILKYTGNDNQSLFTIGNTIAPYNIKLSNIYLQMKENISNINGIEFLQNNPAYLIIEKCKISGFSGDGIKGGHKGHVNNIKILDCFINNCKNGINLQYQAGQINAVWIINNNIVSCTNGILIYGNNCIIKNNTIQANTCGISIGESSWDGTYNQNCFSSHIHDNYFEQNSTPINLYHGYVLNRSYNRLIRKLKIDNNFFNENVPPIQIYPDTNSNLSAKSCLIYVKDNFSDVLEFMVFNGNNAISHGSEVIQNTVRTDETIYPPYVIQSTYDINLPSSVHRDNYQHCKYNIHETIAPSTTTQTTFLIYCDSTSLTQAECNRIIRNMLVDIFVTGNSAYGVAGKYFAKLNKNGFNVSSDLGSLDITNDNNQYVMPFISPITLVKNHPEITGNGNYGIQFTIAQQGTNGFPYSLMININSEYDGNRFIKIKKLNPSKMVGAGVPSDPPSYVGEVYFNISNRRWLIGDDNNEWVTTSLSQ